MQEEKMKFKEGFSMFMLKVKNIDFKEGLKKLAAIMGIMSTVLVVFVACGFLIYGIVLAAADDAKQQKNWENSITTTSVKPLKVIRFSFEGHEYLCFFCDKIPSIKGPLVHNPDCPCQVKKEGK